MFKKLKSLEENDPKTLLGGIARIMYFSINKTAGQRYSDRIDRVLAEQDKTHKTEMARERAESETKAKIAAQKKLDNDYAHVVKEMGGGHNPLEIKITEDEGGNPAADRMTARFDIPYELPNGQKHVFAIELDQARGFKDTSDDNFKKAITIAAYREFAQQKYDLDVALATGNTPKEVLGLNAAISTARSIGKNYFDERETVHSTMKAQTPKR